jgi:alpha-beta hydrolase superfamily lysophospholipase
MSIPRQAETVKQIEHGTLYQWSNPALTDAACTPLLIHGLGGCLAWMEPFIDSLLNYYPLVTGLDNSLYGPNSLETGHISSRLHLLQAVQESVEAVHKQFNKPVVLIGLSLGGLIVSHALARATQHLPIAGVVLISPAFKGSSSSFKAKTYAQVLTRALLLKSAKPIAIPYDISSITSNVKEQERLRNATGCIRSLTADSFLELLKLTLSRRQFHRLDYPLLLMRADEDLICDVSAMDKEWQRWPHPQKQLMVFANAKHDLVLEPVYPQMASLIHGWENGLLN